MVDEGESKSRGSGSGVVGGDLGTHQASKYEQAPVLVSALEKIS